MLKDFIDYTNEQLGESTILNRSKIQDEVPVCPVWEKTLLSLEEASKYSGLGIHKLRDISNADDCKFVLWNGTKRMFKRKLLDEYLESVFSI